MNHERLLPAIRAGLKRKLHTWMPSNADLVKQELEIFDSYMSRRDFLKVASVSAMAACVLHGEDNATFNGPPSQWSVGGKTSKILRDAQLSVPEATNIVLDADIVDSVQPYNPIDAKGPTIVGDTVIESFNPHIMTVDIDTEQTLAIDRTFGIPEIVQLRKNDSASNYVLCTYSNTDEKTPALEYQEKWLEGTSTFGYSSIVGANGNCHNKIKDGLVYNQKLYLLSERSPSVFSDTLGSIFYQAYTHAPLAPGVEFDESSVDATWKKIDLMTLFYAVETYAYAGRIIFDVNRYTDGEHNSFIYGTILCGGYFSYGFVITFDDFTLTPKVRFFHLHFQSAYHAAYRNFMANMSTQLATDNALLWQQLFGGIYLRTFVPLAVDGSDIVFRQVLIEGFEGLHWPDVTTTAFEQYKKTYLFNVSTSGTSTNGLQRLFNTANYTVPPRYEFDNVGKYFTMRVEGYVPELKNFKSYLDGTMQIGALKDLVFTRFTRKEGNGDLSLIVNYPDAKNYADLTMIYKAFSLKRSGDAYEKSETLPYMYRFYLLFKPTVESMQYKDLWYNQIAAQIDPVNNPTSLGAMITQTGQGLFAYQMMHNPDGALRCHFLIGENKAIRTDSYHEDGKTVLISFNEAGDAYTFDALLAAITPNTLFAITSSSFCYPPVPIAFDALHIDKMAATAQDGEVIYTSKRLRLKDETSKRLIPNSAGVGVYSYFHAISEAVEGRWNLSELEKNSAVGTNTYIDSRHRINLATTNIYGAPVGTPKPYIDPADPDREAKEAEEVFVELRFDTPLRLSDKTDPLNPRHYYVNSRKMSIFVRPNAQGKMILEADLGGSPNKRYQGATASYRLVRKGDLQLADGRPVAVLSNLSTSTTGFKACNISFAAYDRLGGTQHPMLQPNTIDTKLGATNTTLDDTQRGNLKGAFAAMAGAARPNNTQPLTPAPLLYKTTLSRRGVRSITLRSATQVSFDPLTGILRVGSAHQTRGLFDVVSAAFRFVQNALEHAIDTIRDLAEAAAAKAKQALEAIKAKTIEAFGAVLDTLGDIAAGTLAVIDAAAALAAGLYHYLKEVVGNAVKSVVEFLQELIESVFGYHNTSYAIGNELKLLLQDQFTRPTSSTLDKNVYTRFESYIQDVLDKYDILGRLDGQLSDVKDQFQIEENGRFRFENNAPVTISDFMKSAQDTLAEGAIKGKLLMETLASNSTHLTAAFETMRGLLEMIGQQQVEFEPSVTEYDANDSLEGLLLKSLGNVKSNTLEGYNTLLEDMSALTNAYLSIDSETQISTEVLDTLALMTKQTIKHAVDNSVTSMQMFTATLNVIPAAIANMMWELTQLDSKIDSPPLRELAGLIFFRDKNKFQSMLDLNFFLVGAKIHVGLSIATTGMDTDKVTGYITTGGLRTAINSGLQSAMTLPLGPDAWDIKVNFALQAVDSVLSLFQDAVQTMHDAVPNAEASDALNKTTFIKVADFLVVISKVAQAFIAVFNVISILLHLPDDELQSDTQVPKVIMGVTDALYKVIKVVSKLMKLVNLPFKLQGIVAILSNTLNMVTYLIQAGVDFNRTDLSDTEKYLWSSSIGHAMLATASSSVNYAYKTIDEAQTKIITGVVWGGFRAAETILMIEKTAYKLKYLSERVPDDFQ